MSARPRWDALWRGVHLATMSPGRAGDWGVVTDAAIAVKDGRIAWIGAERELPAADTQAEHDGAGAWLTPGLVDCHTHIVYAGNRSDEFEARANGATYEEIARAGGGIAATVRATRAASEDELLACSLPRVDRLLSDGVTTLEIKSGYGLALEPERRMLRVAREIGRRARVEVRTTFLGLHGLPPEYAGHRDRYVRHVADDMLAALAAEGLVDAVDAFCESIAFAPQEVERVFDRARALGLPVKLHAEQLSDQGGAALVARHGGLSADHLEYLGPAGIGAMKAAGCVAVLLPGAFHFLREKQLPPVATLREAGVPMAVSTDCNPGTSPMPSLLAAMSLSCTLFGLSPAEAFAGATRHAAAALGLRDRGVLEMGHRADFALWRIERPADLVHGLGNGPCLSRVVEGTHTT